MMKFSLAFFHLHTFRLSLQKNLIDFVIDVNIFLFFSSAASKRCSPGLPPCSSSLSVTTLAQMVHFDFFRFWRQNLNQKRFRHQNCIASSRFSCFSYTKITGIFSCIITLASVVQLVGLIFLLMQVFKHGNFENLSIKMLQCYVWVYICRLCATTREQGYLPIDASGDWCYQLADSCSLVLCLVEENLKVTG